MEARLSLITLGVGDLARARRFYEDGLGWRASEIGGEAIVFFQAGGLIVGLYGRDDLAADANLEAGEPVGTFAGIALAHNVRAREEVDQVLSEAEAAGARIVKPAQDAFWGGYSGYFADPDGHLWEVAWNPGFTITGDGATILPDQRKP